MSWWSKQLCLYVLEVCFALAKWILHLNLSFVKTLHFLLHLPTWTRDSSCVEEQTAHFLKFSVLVSLLFCWGRQLLLEKHTWCLPLCSSSVRWQVLDKKATLCRHRTSPFWESASISAHRSSGNSVALQNTLCLDVQLRCWDWEGWGRQLAVMVLIIAWLGCWHEPAS